MIDSLFIWLASHYREELYLSGSKAAGVLCSFADIAMIWMLLRLVDELHGSRSRKRYTALTVFAVLTPSLLAPHVTTYFFILQFLVLGVPYMILVWTAASEAKTLLAHIKDKIQRG